MNVNDLFGPLNNQYCDYFYILSVIFFIVFIFTLIMCVANMFEKKSMKITDAAILITQPLLLYFINRLYYSMCVGSLQ